MKKAKLLKQALFLIIIIGILIALLKDYIEKYIPIWITLPLLIIIAIINFVAWIKIGKVLKEGGKEIEELRKPVRIFVISSMTYVIIMMVIFLILGGYLVYSFFGFKILSPYTLFFLGILIDTISLGWLLAIFRKKEYLAPKKGSVYEKELNKKMVPPAILTIVGGILIFIAIFLFF